MSRRNVDPSHTENFFTHAIRQHPRLGNNLVYRLRGLGSPSARTSPDTIDKVLEIMGAITAYRFRGRSKTDAEPLIVSNWTSTFEPWVKFLLQNILATEDPPDLSDVIRHENALLSLPGLLLFQNRDQNSSTLSEVVTFMTTIGRTSPEIPRLAAEVWTKLLGNHHITWRDWTSLMPFIINPLTKPEPEPEPEPQSDYPSDRPGIPTSGIYEGNHRIGLIFVSHLNYQTQHLSEMTLTEMQIFGRSFALMDDATFKGESPLFLDSIRQYSLPAVIKLLSSTLRRQPKDMDFAECADSIGSTALKYLFGLMSDYHWISEALRHGIVKAVLNVHPSVFQAEAVYSTHGGVMSHNLASILQRVSGFLFYQSVLHQFSSASRKISRSGKLEKRMKENSQVYKAWMEAKENASVIRDIRRMGKEDGSLNLCRSVQCPRNHPEAVEETALDVKYFYCAGCSSVMYCSQTCQRSDWNDGHRENCLTRRNARPLSGLPYMKLPDYDTVFFAYWAKNFAMRNHQSMQDLVDKHLAQLKLTSQSHQSESQASLEAPAHAQLITPDQQAILDRIRNPLLIVQFLHRPALVTLDSTMDIFRYHYHKDQLSATEEIISQWQTSEVTEILVMARFPVQPSRWMHFWFKSPFGDFGSEDEEDGDGDDRDRYFSRARWT
ncbi:hypothetical protein L218DRAFT_1003008 [Marasmius fiardii PR-910]|nr:hypothetical protein L218DRAFT_1003008 [Marasmius fiardii PR-910]